MKPLKGLFYWKCNFHMTPPVIVGKSVIIFLKCRNLYAPIGEIVSMIYFQLPVIIIRLQSSLCMENIQ